MAKILVITDRVVNDKTAIRRAGDLAMQLGDSLHIVSFVYEPLDDSGEKDPKEVSAAERKSAINTRKLKLEKQVEELASQVKIRTTVVWEKNVAGWVIKHENKKKYRFIVKTAAHTGNLFHTSTDWRLMRECKNSVLILAEKKWKKRNRILTTVDLSSRAAIQKKLNEKAVKKSLKLVEKLSGEVHVCFVVPVPRVLLDLDVIDERAFKYKAKKRYLSSMENLIDGRVPVENLHILFGEPDRRIPSLANKLKTDLVVMGTIGRRGVKARIFGNTAEKTLTRLFTDVLALKP